MSKSALYKGLGVGLMSFGDGLAKQMAETARQRREESLLALKRQWDLDDRDAEFTRQDSLLDRQEESARQQEANRLANNLIQVGTERQIRDEEWARGQPDRDAERARMKAQTDLYSAQAGNVGNNRTPTNRADVFNDRYNQLINEGVAPDEAREQALDFSQRLFSPPGADTSGRVREKALEMATDAMSLIEEHRLSASAFGITEDTPESERLGKVLAFYEELLMPSTQAGPPPPPPPTGGLMEVGEQQYPAVDPGVERQIIELLEQGMSEEEITAMLQQSSRGSIDARSIVTGVAGRLRGVL